MTKIPQQDKGILLDHQSTHFFGELEIPKKLSFNRHDFKGEVVEQDRIFQNKLPHFLIFKPPILINGDNVLDLMSAQNEHFGVLIEKLDDPLLVNSVFS